MKTQRVYNRAEATRRLWNRLCTIPDFVTRGRVLRDWSDLQPEEKPALFMIAGNQRVDTPSQKLPSVLHMFFTLFVYAHKAQADDITPSDELNRLLDLIEQSIDPGIAMPYQTLGLDNCQHVYVSGMIETDEGSLGSDAVAIVPLTMLLT